MPVIGRNLFPSMLAVAALSGCAIFNPNRQFRVYEDLPNAGARLVLDTPEVRRLLADEDAREEALNRFWKNQHSTKEGDARVQDMMAHPDSYPPGRTTFLAAMVSAPGFYVPQKSYCKIVQSSQSRCSVSPIETRIYKLVRNTSGLSRGKEGWVCGPVQLNP
jgi:hypothetical protein